VQPHDEENPMKPLSTLALLPLCALLTAGCAVSRSMPVAAEAPAAMAAPPPVLTRSLFSKDSSGSLAEDDLQKVLETPIDLQFPARVGVVPLAEPFNPQGPVSIATRGVASRDLARALIGHPHYSHVSDISTELPNMGGIEGLRVIAARYRMRYLLLYSERFEDATHLNGWAWLYPTVVGMFLAPGVTVASRGIAQADLLDVRTGTILFSVVQPIDVSEQSLMIGAARSHEEYQREAAAKAAKALAKRVGAQTKELIAWADRAAAGEGLAKTRILPAPIAPAVSQSAAPGGGASSGSSSSMAARP
jgi:rhombotail lipoprotein